MSKILLDYVFPISVIESIPAASTAFLKQVAVVCKPKAGQEGNVGQLFECTSMTQVATRTDNTEAEQLFNAGMTKVYILLADDLDLATYLDTHKNKFFTLVICSQFSDEDIATGEQVTTPEVKATRKIQDILYTSKLDGAEGNAITVAYTSGATAGAEVVSIANTTEISVQIETGVSTAQQIATAILGHVDANALVQTAVDEGDEADPQETQSQLSLQGGVDEVTDDGDGLDVGTYDGVIGFATDDTTFGEAQAILKNRCVFFKDVSTGAKNTLYAFGKLLSILNDWKNLQYIEMPFADGADLLGEANSLFDKKMSFVIEDDEFAKRLALFVAGGKAIVAPYILKNLKIDMQSRALTWIAANQPQYTLRDAALLEARIQEDVINLYISRNWITEGSIDITLDPNSNFVASGEIEVPTPKALWRVFNQMTES